VIGAGLGLAAAAALAHLLLTSVRRRRRDLAIFKTLGFTRRQVQGAVAWQATTIVAIGVLIGLPVGLALGRFGWNVYAHDLGVASEPILPVAPAALLIPAAIVLANVVAALPAWRAAATRPAVVLRAE
jgi:ABC-type lipoprotein release transport system permease subunit